MSPRLQAQLEPSKSKSLPLPVPRTRYPEFRIPPLHSTPVLPQKLVSQSSIPAVAICQLLLLRTRYTSDLTTFIEVHQGSLWLF